MSQEKIQVRCECPGCDDVDCNAIAHLTCNRTKNRPPEELRDLGWRTSNGAWLCPICSRGLPGRPPPRYPGADPKTGKKLRRKSPRQYSIPRHDTEPASDPIWQQRGSLLLTYLAPSPKSWEQLTSWARSLGFDEAMLRNIIASVDDSVVYQNGLWRAVVARGKFEPAPPGPPCTLRARIATEAMRG